MNTKIEPGHRLMSRYSKANSKGRSSGRPLPGIKKLRQPPEGSPWVWLTKDLLESPAWRGMSVNTRKLIDFLLIEHASHAGWNNGRLRATYDQLEGHGLTRRNIRYAIAEAEALGLARQVGSSARRVPNVYRLTFYSTIFEDRMSGDWATNDWRSITDEDVRSLREDQRAEREANAKRRGRRSNQNQNPSEQRHTDLVRKKAPQGRSESTDEAQISGDSKGGGSSTPSISPGGGSDESVGGMSSADTSTSQLDLFEDRKPG